MFVIKCVQPDMFYDTFSALSHTFSRCGVFTVEEKIDELLVGNGGGLNLVVHYFMLETVRVGVVAM